MGRGTCGLTTSVVFLCPSDKTIKLWKVAERDKRPEGYNLKDEGGLVRDPSNITKLRVPVFQPMELMVEASPKRVFSNAHTYHINSISVNSDQETYLSADDLRINLWNLEITDQSFSILRTVTGVCGAGMEQISELIPVCCWIMFSLIILFVREDSNFGFEGVLFFFDSQVLFESINLMDAGCFRIIPVDLIMVYCSHSVTPPLLPSLVSSRNCCFLQLY